MGKSTQPIVFSTFRLLNLVIGCAFFALSGCSTADIITYSRDAQRQGENSYQQADYADAAGAFRNSVRQNPQNYEGYYWLGASYEKLSQYQQAIPAYKTARETIGLSLQGKYNVNFRYKILNGLASAIAHSDSRDIEIDAAQKEAQSKGSSDSWYLMAKIYADRGDADSAIDAFNRSSLLEPNNFQVNKEYGICTEKVGQADQAAPHLRKAYASNTQDTEVTDALRRIGIVPGPSIKDQRQLAEPLVPRGPIPELPLPNPSGGSSPAGPSVAAPRD